ncbi:hypothetical protein CERSUDRAFT_78756, partial [Gelatoporia subvermispora B]
ARPSTRRPPPANAIGRRWTLLIFTTVFSVGAILQTVAGGSRGLGYVYAGRVVAGVGIGAISAVAPAYVSECAPKDVRGRITGLFQIMVAIGVMLSYFINLGISLHEPSGPQVWRIPFGFQLVPAGIMALGLLTVTEAAPDDALAALAYLRRRHPDDDSVRHEMAEIDAALEEERAARAGLGWKEAFFGKGNWPRFLIAIVIFLLQQWSGQNSVGYYAPQIFTSIGYNGTSNSLLASGIYGIVKVVATALFVFFLVDSLGRKRSLLISALGMGTLFFIIGALLKAFPPPTDAHHPAPRQQGHGRHALHLRLLLLHGLGPPPMGVRRRHLPDAHAPLRLAVASASQWLFNFVLSKVTPDLVSDLGYKVFLMFGTINIGGMATFTL